jgi:hypothetical protein
MSLVARSFFASTAQANASQVMHDRQRLSSIAIGMRKGCSPIERADSAIRREASSRARAGWG